MNTRRIIGFVIFLTVFSGLFEVSLEIGQAQTMPKRLNDNRIKIVVIDTGVDVNAQIRPFMCEGGHLSLVDDTPLEDSSSMKHGTNIVGLVTQKLDPKKYCVIMVKFWRSETGSDVANVIMGVKYAGLIKAQFLNLSLTGTGESTIEYDALMKDLGQGMKIAVSAGNDNQNLDLDCSYFPACYNFHNSNFHVVGAVDSSGQRYVKGMNGSNYGAAVRYKELGVGQGHPPCTGTSQATAIHLNKWILEDSN